jgi:parallel beta-helix repeat protein
MSGHAPALAGGSTHTVGSTANAGPMTLREAIDSANASSGSDVINFDPGVFTPDNPGVIVLTDALPEIDGDDGVMVDGSGAGVVIDGASTDAGTMGLVVHSGTQDLSGVTLRALTVRSFPGHGISVCGGELPGCGRDVTGLELEGVVSSGNGGDGVRILGQEITGLALGNCTSADNGGYGILIQSGLDSSDVRVSDCSSIGNGDMGIFVTSLQRIVDFGLTDSSVSQNGTIGAYLDSVEETISPTIDNVEAVGNGQMGIGFNAAQPLSDLVLKDSEVDANGSTSGNGLGTEVLAFQITDATISGNSFSNNVASTIVGGVGFQVYSQFEMPSGLVISDNTVNNNVGRGIAIITDQPGQQQPDLNVISDNEVSGNTGDGVAIVDSRRVTISDNRIFGNGGIGIDLAGGEPEEAIDHVTPNDPGDGDQGSNKLLNFPVLTGISGATINGTACSGCTVALYVSDGDPTGYGEGRTFVDDSTATGGSFAIPVSELCADDQVTATATDPDGNTSEFSANFVLVADVGECAELIQGDVDCNGQVTSVDALKELRHVAQLSVSQPQPCPVIGSDVASIWGDVDCSGEVTSVDALKILRYVASLPNSQNEPCPDIGMAED